MQNSSKTLVAVAVAVIVLSAGATFWLYQRSTAPRVGTLRPGPAAGPAAGPAGEAVKETEEEHRKLWDLKPKDKLFGNKATLEKNPDSNVYSVRGTITKIEGRKITIEEQGNSLTFAVPTDLKVLRFPEGGPVSVGVEDISVGQWIGGGVKEEADGTLVATALNQ